MNDGLDEIRRTIHDGDTERARQLLRIKLMSNPTAEIYFLSAQVASSDAQRLDFLEKTLALDPFHAGASDALALIKQKERQTEDDTPSNAKDTPNPAMPAENAAPTAPPQPGMSRYILADFGARFAAFFIDGLIVSFVIVMLLFVFAPPPELTPEISEEEYIQLFIEWQFEWQNRVTPVFYILLAIYATYFLAYRNGQTLGKRLLRIRVVKLDGQPLTLMDATIRSSIGYPLSIAFLLVGFFWAFLDKRRQGWHDKLANTVVVRIE